MRKIIRKKREPLSYLRGFKDGYRAGYAKGLKKGKELWEEKVRGGERPYSFSDEELAKMEDPDKTYW